VSAGPELEQRVHKRFEMFGFSKESAFKLKKKGYEILI
jgi:hypothetical protein